MQQHDLTKSIQTGLKTLSSEDVKIPSKDIEDLANFKDILKAILSGQLVIATPDRVISQVDVPPIKEAPAKEVLNGE